MAGLGNQGMEAAPAAQPAPDEYGMQAEGGEPATPEEQAAYEKMMAAVEGIDSTHVMEQLSGKMAPQEVELFAKAAPPFEPTGSRDALAGTAVLLLITVDNQLGYQKLANDQDDEANPNYAAVLQQVGTDLLGMLADIAADEGIHDYNEQELSDAMLRAVDLYQQSSPTLDREVMKERFLDLAMADKQGRLGDLLPNLPAQPEQQEQPAPAPGGGLGQPAGMQMGMV